MAGGKNNLLLMCHHPHVHVKSVSIPLLMNKRFGTPPKTAPHLSSPPAPPPPQTPASQNRSGLQRHGRCDRLPKSRTLIRPHVPPPQNRSRFPPPARPQPSQGGSLPTSPPWREGGSGRPGKKRWGVGRELLQAQRPPHARLDR